MTENNIEQTMDTLYSFIHAYIQDNGYAPSLREISKGCYLGRSTVMRYLDKLEARGRIHRADGKARSITLAES